MRSDALTGRRQRKTTFKRHSMVGRFLTSEYGISWRDIAAKGRLALLEDVESVPCNLCGETDATPVAARDKYGLPVTTVMCRRCGLLYLNPRPATAAYARFYEGGGWSSAYHRHLDVDALDEVLSWYFGSEFSMTAGYEVIRKATIDQPKGRRLHVFGRKVSSPVSVDWPSYDAEWAAFATIPPSAPRHLIEEMATKIQR